MLGRVQYAIGLRDAVATLGQRFNDLVQKRLVRAQREAADVFEHGIPGMQLAHQPAEVRDQTIARVVQRALAYG